MVFLNSRLGIYLTQRTLSGIMTAMAAVLAAILLIDLVETMRSVGGDGDLSLLDGLRLTSLKLPMLIEQTMPFIVLAGAMLATIGLNRSSELIALRAAGVSAWRFLTPPAATALAIGLLVITVVNPIGAHAYQAFEAEKARLVSSARQIDMRNGVWIRQGDENGQVVIHADGFDANAARLDQVTFMFFEVRGGALQFERRIRAEHALLRPGFWQLSNLVEATPGGAPERQANLAIPTTLDPSELLDRFVAPATLSFWRLPAFIGEARAAGFAPTRYELKWHSLLAYPLMLAAMAGLGAVFSLRLQRLGNAARWGAVGVALGLFLFFFSQLSGAFAIAQATPAAVSAWSAPLAGAFTALAMVAFLEDG